MSATPTSFHRRRQTREEVDDLFGPAHKFEIRIERKYKGIVIHSDYFRIDEKNFPKLERSSYYVYEEGEEPMKNVVASIVYYIEGRGCSTIYFYRSQFDPEDDIKKEVVKQFDRLVGVFNAMEP